MNTISEGLQALIEQHMSISQASVFKLLGFEWDLLPGVYAPNLTRCAALYAEWLPYPIGGAFCEIGTGTGYLSVLAAMKGCKKVLATDINPEATANAKLNVKRYGFDDIVKVACGDMFSTVKENDRFDVIFWNSSYIDQEIEASSKTMLNHAFTDPGYQSHRKFLQEVGRYLQPGGEAYLGFANVGNADSLIKIANECGWKLKLCRIKESESLMGSIQYQLLRLDAIT